MAFVVWPPSADPRDYQEPGRWEAARAEALAADPAPQVRLSLRLLAVACYATGFVGATEAHGALRYVLWALAVVPWGAVLVLRRIGPRWAMEPRDRPAAGSGDRSTG